MWLPHTKAIWWLLPRTTHAVLENEGKMVWQLLQLAFSTPSLKAMQKQRQTKPLEAGPSESGSHLCSAGLSSACANTCDALLRCGVTIFLPLRCAPFGSARLPPGSAATGTTAPDPFIITKVRTILHIKISLLHFEKYIWSHKGSEWQPCKLLKHGKKYLEPAAGSFKSFVRM